MSVRLFGALAVAVLLTSNGCESCDRTLPPPLPKDAKERFARAACTADMKCRCGLHASQAACETEVAAKFEEVVDMGVTVDEACFDAWLVSPIFTECAEGNGTAPRCMAMVGGGEVGDTCFPWNLFGMLPGETCKAGLACSLEGYCQDPYAPPNWGGDGIHVGDPCNPDFPLSCAQLYCVDATSTCAERKLVGESCMEFEACEFGAFCEGLISGVGVCTPHLKVGEPCSPDDDRPCHPSWCDPDSLVCVETNPAVCINQPVW